MTATPTAFTPTDTAPTAPASAPASAPAAPPVTEPTPPAPIRASVGADQPVMPGIGRPVLQWVEDAGPAEGVADAARTLVEDLDATARSGKSVRSGLFHGVYDALGGDSEVVRAAAGEAIEQLHEALLVHDDIADGDDHRRGEPNLIGRTATRAAADGVPADVARHVGVVGGLLGGDLLLVSAIAGVARLSVDADRREAAVAEFERAVIASAAGEFQDVRCGALGRPTTVEESLGIAAHKTAAYSVELPLVLAAVLAGAAPSLVETLRAVGRDVGTAYQVADDLLGVFGDPERTGKSVDSDLLRRTPTTLLAHAAETPEWSEIASALDPEGDAPADPATARRLLDSCGARSRSLALARDLLVRARARLAEPDVPPAVSEALAGLLETVVERTR